MFRVLETIEYRKWFNKQNLKAQAQIHSRIARIRNDGYFDE